MSALGEEEPVCFILRKWEQNGHKHHLAWGGLLAAGTFRERGFNVLVLTAQEQQFEGDEMLVECEAQGHGIERFGYDDDAVLMADEAFKARLIEKAQ